VLKSAHSLTVTLWSSEINAMSTYSHSSQRKNVVDSESSSNGRSVQQYITELWR